MKKIILILLFSICIVYADIYPIKEGQKYNNTHVNQPNIFERANKYNNTHVNQSNTFERADKYNKTDPHQLNMFERANKYNREHRGY